MNEFLNKPFGLGKVGAGACKEEQEMQAMLERDLMIKQLSKHLHISQNHGNSSRERLNIYM